MPIVLIIVAWLLVGLLMGLVMRSNLMPGEMKQALLILVIIGMVIWTLSQMKLLHYLNFTL